jgi:DNA-binding Xre family transcriptional regulator
VGTSNQQISHLELGHRQLTVDWLQRLASALGCHPWDIVEDGAHLKLSDDERRLIENFRQIAR